ncbi:zinc finger MYM-type protein 1-like [Myzus persicae]|uniref:zinc finger MYM-type protein 1-like n=1 Tax=Myzus persicae TaxID=13164 RepID=UPI000B9392BB|nr:zinc finger MYM-type protein 1-like [Myzus persicae]
MSNQVKDQIYVRTVSTSIDFDKKEASQNCKIKNIETNNVDTLETVKCNVKDSNVQYDCWFSNDPAKWVLNESEFDYYSKNQRKTKFSRPVSGYINWKNCLLDVNHHEKCIKLTESVQINKEEEYWTKLLHRLIETISFLATRGLAFRGDNETIGSKFNGNYLGCLELLSKFDPFLANHIDKYSNKGRGNVSYLSSRILCDEFIDLMSKTVLQCIVKEIKIAKYFSIIVDSTPDVTKVDQLTVAVRYICKDGSPVERFIGFLPSVGHKAKEMELELMKMFKNLDIDMINCRGQSFDNANNMSGIYNGLQARIKQKSSTAEFVPCSAHSLNLVGTFVAELTSTGNTFFLRAQNLYTFFSASTSRWNTLSKELDQIPNAQLLKNLCPTRWSSRHSVCKSIKNGYVGILAALEIIYNDLNQRNAVKHESKSIYNKIKSLDFVFLLVVWTPLLERFDKTSKSLQLINIDLSCVVSLYDSFVCYIQEQRNNFEIFLSEAIKISGINKFSWEETRTKRRNIFFDEESSGEVIFSNSDKMKNEAFIPIMDALILQLNKRKEAYTKLCDKFGFFSDMEIIEASELRKKALKLVEYYVNDLEVEFVEEIVQFKKYIINFPKETKNMQGMLKP